MAFLVAFVGKRSRGLEREEKDGDVTFDFSGPVEFPDHQQLFLNGL